MREIRLYKFAGLLLLLTGVSHMTQVFLYEPTFVVKTASLFGLVYTLLGFIALYRVLWLPWLAIVICSIGFGMGTARMLSQPFNVQFAVHQAVHLIVISTFLIVVISRHNSKTRA